MRFSILSTILAVVCMTLATTVLAAAEGYWKLVDTKLIDLTQTPGTTVKIRRHTNSFVEYESLLPGAASKVYRASWTPPAEILIPDGPVLTKVTATIVSVPPNLNHNAGIYIGCAFEHFGIGPGASSGSGIGGAGAEIVGRAPGTRSDKKIIKAPRREFGDGQGRMEFNVDVGNGIGKLGATYVYKWIEGRPPRINQSKPDVDNDDDSSSSSADKNTNNTAWNVGHPTPWVFHPDGTIEAKGLWQGTWTRNGNDYNVTIVHMGVKDSFTVRFSQDGRSFTAYKDGQTYRQGVRR